MREHTRRRILTLYREQRGMSEIERAVGLPDGALETHLDRDPLFWDDCRRAIREGAPWNDAEENAGLRPEIGAR